MFVDRADITIKAGDGGDGCCSFRREAFVPKGGPNGGDGAPGGDIIFIGDPGEQSLLNFIYNRRFQAQDGGDGKGKDMHGRSGKPLYIKVPPGTLVYNRETNDLLADIDEPYKEVVVAVGGRGGRGNARFASSVNRAPREHEPGEKTEPVEIRLELKMIADIGLVGYPNAGKSTFLSAVSNARPKVAPYPFTTLHPVIGVMEYPDFAKITVADIPGLIDGAHLNAGLGHYFLRHIERTKMLVYVLDMAGVDGRNPLDDLKVLQKELEEYMKGLSRRALVILANKMDLPEAAGNLEELQLDEAAEGLEIIPLSAASDPDFSAVKERLRFLLEEKASSAPLPEEQSLSSGVF